MKLISKLLVVMVFFMAIDTYAKSKNIFTIAELADQYYAQKEVALQHQPPNCLPQGPSCLDVACSKLGPFGCDSQDEIRDMGKACRGNFDGNCVEFACNKLNTFGCDSNAEVEGIARACVGNYDSNCFDSICGRLGVFGCDSNSEVEEVLRSCSGN